MSHTMPRNISRPVPPGERRIMCDYCGAVYYRSSLVKDPAGRWACPDDQDGRDTVTLDRLNQQNALNAYVPRGPREPW